MTLVNTRNMYHVHITLKESKPPHRRFEWEYDLSFEQLEQRFLFPYSKANPVVIKGRIISIDDLFRIRVYKTPERVRHLANKQAVMKMMEDVTGEFIIHPPGYATSTQDEPANNVRPATNAREVFVVHGRNAAARDAMFEFLRSLDLHPLEWSEAVSTTGKPSPYISEILDAAFSRAHAVVVLLTPDGTQRGTLKPRLLCRRESHLSLLPMARATLSTLNYRKTRESFSLKPQKAQQERYSKLRPPEV